MIIYFIIIIFILYLYVNNTEEMVNTSSNTSSNSAVDAMQTLGAMANKLMKGGFTCPGDLTSAGKLVAGDTMIARKDMTVTGKINGSELNLSGNLSVKGKIGSVGGLILVPITTADNPLFGNDGWSEPISLASCTHLLASKECPPGTIMTGWRTNMPCDNPTYSIKCSKLGTN